MINLICWYHYRLNCDIAELVKILWIQHLNYSISNYIKYISYTLHEESFYENIIGLLCCERSWFEWEVWRMACLLNLNVLSGKRIKQHLVMYAAISLMLFMRIINLKKFNWNYMYLKLLGIENQCHTNLWEQKWNSNFFSK